MGGKKKKRLTRAGIHTSFSILFTVLLVMFPKNRRKKKKVILLCRLIININSHLVFLLTSVGLKKWQRMCFSLANQSWQWDSILYCSIN